MTGRNRGILAIATAACALLWLRRPRTEPVARIAMTAPAPAPPVAPRPSNAAVRQVIAGVGFSCALHVDDDVSCWGNGEKLPRAHAKRPDAYQPVPAPALRDVRALAAMRDGACAVLHEGGVQCWAMRRKPALVTLPLEDVAQLRGHCARTEQGTARCIDHRDALTDPIAWRAIEGVDDAIDIDGDRNDGCVLRADHQVACWTLRDESERPRATVVLSDAVQVAHGSGFACAIGSDQRVRCWQTRVYDADKGAMRVRRTPPVEIPGLGAVTKLAAHAGRICAVRNTREVACWDFGDDARAVVLTDAVDVAVGWQHACAIRGGRDVQCWGRNQDGELGNGVLRAAVQRVVVPSGATAIQLTADDQLAVIADGRVHCLDGARACPSHVRDARALSERGDRLTVLDARGRVWVGDEATPRALPPGTQLAGLCVMTKQREVWCDAPQRRKPVRIAKAGRPIRDATELAGSSSGHVLIRRATGQPVLAEPPYDEWCPPLLVNAKDIAMAIDVGYACVVHPDHRAECDALERSYYLIQKEFPKDEPERAPPQRATNLMTVETRGAHTCALTIGGDVACWGDNRHGELGDGTRADIYDDHLVAGVHEVVALTIGSQRVCALQRSGSVWCWGDRAAPPTQHVESPVAVDWP